MSEFLSITHDMAMSTLYLCLILVLIIPNISFFSATVCIPLPCIPGVVQLLSPLCIDVPCLDSQDKVVEDDTALDPHDGPQVPLMRIDLNTKLKQRLKLAFQ